ncbi:MAG: GNAT family N-acetyltransferase, partial [bacterium]
MLKIETHKNRLTDDIKSLAENYRFKPYFFVNAASEEGLRNIFLARIGKFLAKCEDSAHAGFFTANDESGKPLGFIGVEVLDFDTAVLKIPSGRIVFCVVDDDYAKGRPVADALINASMAWLSERGIVFTNARTAALELPLIHALESSGYYLVDNGITALYHKENAPAYEKASYDIRLFSGNDLNTVLEIMRGAYTHDRFHLDPKIPYDAAEELYQVWIHHCAMSPKDQEWVLVAE